jgi:hypothetical protein
LFVVCWLAGFNLYLLHRRVSFLFAGIELFPAGLFLAGGTAFSFNGANYSAAALGQNEGQVRSWLDLASIFLGTRKLSEGITAEDDREGGWWGSKCRMRSNASGDGQISKIIRPGFGW